MCLAVCSITLTVTVVITALTLMAGLRLGCAYGAVPAPLPCARPQRYRVVTAWQDPETPLTAHHPATKTGTRSNHTPSLQIWHVVRAFPRQGGCTHGNLGSAAPACAMLQ